MIEKLKTWKETNMKYSHFKGILYIPEGQKRNGGGYISIVADGKTL